MRRALIIFALAAAICGPACADVLLLKTGVKYVGTISRPAPGKITVATPSGNLTFNDDQVNFKLCVYTRPANYDDVMDMLKRRQYAKAIPSFQSWEKRYRDLPASYYADAIHGLAVCFANTGKKGEAKALYEKLIAAFPDAEYRTDAESWLIENEIDRASGPDIEKKLRTLLASPRGSDIVRARVHSLLGKYFEKEGNIKQALEHYATIIVLYGDVEEFQKTAQYKCAELFGRSHRTNEAMFYASQMLDKDYRQSLTAEEKALCERWAAMKNTAATPAKGEPAIRKGEPKKTDKPADTVETTPKIGAKEVGAPEDNKDASAPADKGEAAPEDSGASSDTSSGTGS